MPELECQVCEFQWDADEWEEPAPDHDVPCASCGGKGTYNMIDGAKVTCDGCMGTGKGAKCGYVGEPGVCASCGGEGSGEIDRFNPSRGHWTEEVPCDACQGDDGPELALDD